MKTTSADLHTEEKQILAVLKASLALALAQEVSRLEHEGAAIGIQIRIFSQGKVLRIPKITNGGSALSLVFFSPDAALSVFSGGKGLAIPVPMKLRAFQVLRLFQKTSSRAQELIKAENTPDSIKARLLLSATLHGLEAVSEDSWLRRRMQIIPDGSVLVRSGDIRFVVQKRGSTIVVAEDTHAEPNAILSFKDYQSAIAVLSGKRQAVVALGLGEVQIKGLLPLVQGLFAVLDRLAWYLGVQV